MFPLVHTSHSDVSTRAHVTQAHIAHLAKKVPISRDITIVIFTVSVVTSITAPPGDRITVF